MNAVTGAFLLAMSATTPHGLRWNAPEGCPDAAAFRAAVEHRLEASLDTLAFDVGVDVDPSPDGFVARVTIADAEQRTLASASCTELSEAVAVIVARLALERRTVPAPLSIPQWNAGLRADFVAGAGSTPELGLAGELVGWFAWRELRIELAAEHWRTSTARLDGADAGVDIHLDTLAVRAGWQRGVIRAWLEGEVGTLSGTGFGVMTAQSGDATWLAGGGGASAAWPVAPHTQIVVGGDVEFVIDRVGFALGSGTVIYRTPPATIRAGVGIEVGWR